MSNLIKIEFHMEEDGVEWIREFNALEGNPDIFWEHKFIPKTGQEEINLRIIRTTKESQNYAAYINSKGFLKI